jgi:exopolysaccharide biosynthesis polyprenyl glycosylphosphotransferase
MKKTHGDSPRVSAPDVASELAVGQAELAVGDIRRALDGGTRDALVYRRRGERRRRRGWFVRRMLLAADLAALTVAFFVAVGVHRTGAQSLVRDVVLLIAMLPAWVVVAKLYGLYDRDEERADHSTADELAGVVSLVTAGSWFFVVFGHITGFASPSLARSAAFWTLAIALIVLGRGLARFFCRRSVWYLQNTLIVGAGDVGQLIARKLLQHPEYGLNLVGFIDSRPKKRRNEVAHLAVLGGPEQLRESVQMLDVERVIFAFSNGSNRENVQLARSLRDLDVQIDVVPRLFEIVGPNVGIHTVEGLPLVGMPPARLSRSSRLIKRSVDIAGAGIGLLVTAPLFALFAGLIKRDSEGPVFFRQRRLGYDMRQFTALKFRTMHVGADDRPHREYIRQTMSSDAEVGQNGIYKLQRDDAVTSVGRWLRKTSLDELPQLINVLRGDMSLVGPRPCLPYELENFAPHHFDRFLVPAGLTGLWQVRARGRSTFGEALDMDVMYARGWSLGLDFKLLCLTPLQLVPRRSTA